MPGVGGDGGRAKFSFNAGFAHLSCIIQYAELKSKQAKDRDLSAFVELWKTCPSCKQPYQNQLSMDLSSRFVSFVDVTYGYPGNGESDKMKVMTALRYKIDELISVLRPHAVIEDISNEDLKKYATLKMECEPLIRKLLSMVDEMKKEKKMDRWVHMPHFWARARIPWLNRDNHPTRDYRDGLLALALGLLLPTQILS